MGKKKRERKPRQLPTSSGGPTDGDSSPDEMYDEVDQFHRRRDLPHLDDGVEADESSGAEEVLGVRPDAEDSDDHLSDDEPGGFDKSSDDDDDEEAEKNEEGYLPSASAWGKRRADFYNTSYVDKDYGGFSGSDAEDAELEEQEARTLQKKLAEAITVDDYGLDDVVTGSAKPAEKQTVPTGKVVDVASLTESGKLDLFKQQSPELEGLIEEYNEKRDVLEHLLEPFADVVKSRQPPNDHPFLEQIRSAMEIYANYLLNIQFYLYAKATNGVTSTNQLQNHPVLDRIMQWKKLVDTADAFVERSKVTLDALLVKLKEGDDLVALLPSRPTDERRNESKKSKKRKIFEDDDAEQPLDDPYAANDAHTVDASGDGKRAINYEMEKNKGLTAKRRKDISHSRIKRRKQYDKALIRRRGQVPDVKRELNKYGGEMRGIKTSVVKSVKLKT